MKLKNAARFLPEWIEFHQIVGFQHFYLYNNITDNYIEALAPYRAEGSVTLYEWPDTPAFPKADEGRSYWKTARTKSPAALWISGP